jgi:hypothetical protein
MSFSTGKSPEECGTYFQRHLQEIPFEENRIKAERYLLEKEEYVKYSTMGSYLGHVKAFGIWIEDMPWLEASRDDVFDHIKDARGQKGIHDRRLPV